MELLKQFFSFDKLMKDRLVAAFFYLGLVVVVVMFLGTIKLAFAMMDMSFSKGVWLLLVAFFQILFLFVLLRLTAELMIAVFHINDNLSPDGGKSETAELDVIEAAREAASKAAKSASSATKSALEKTKSKINEVRDGDDDDDVHEYEAPKPKPAPKRRPAAKKAPVKKAPAKRAAARKTAAKKPAAKKPAARKTTTRKKPAPKK